MALVIVSWDFVVVYREVGWSGDGKDKGGLLRGPKGLTCALRCGVLCGWMKHDGEVMSRGTSDVSGSGALSGWRRWMTDW